MHPDLLILCATDHEMAPFLDCYPHGHEWNSRTHVRVFEGDVDHVSYQLALTGPGVLNTAHSLTLLLEQHLPKMILQTGIAGVYKGTGLGVGDVAAAYRSRYIHTGVTCQDGENRHQLGWRDVHRIRDGRSQRVPLLYGHGSAV